jgi:hypothetical protein
MNQDKNKSQLAKDLDHALFACRLRDDLSELLEDFTFRDHLPEHYETIRKCHVKAIVVLACAVVDSTEIKAAAGIEQ